MNKPTKSFLFLNGEIVDAGPKKTHIILNSSAY